MALNWLPNVEFNKEFRTYTTKDIETNAKAIEEARKDQVSARSALRDLQRKRAIEKATANAIDAKGEMSEPKLRQALIDAGFGEDAEATANKIYKERVAVKKENLGLRKDLAEATAMGYITEDDANRVLTGGVQAPVQNAPQTTPEKMEAIKNGTFNWNALAGQKPDATVGPQPASTVAQEPAKPVSEPKVVTGVSQFSPGYAQMGPIDFGKYNTPSQTVSPVKFELSSDPNLQAKQIAAIKQELQFDIPKGASKEEIDRIVNERIDSMASAGNVMPSKAAFGGDLAKYKMKEAEVASAFGKAKNELLGKLSGQVNTGRQLGTGERQATTSEKSQALSEAKATLPGFGFKGDPGIINEINKQNAQAARVSTLANELSKMKNTDPGYKGKSMTLAKTLIQAKGLGVSEGVLDAMSSQMGGQGFDIARFIKDNASTATEAGQNFLRELYRSQTTGNVNFLDMAKDVQRANRAYMLTLKPTDMDSFIEGTPILGETEAEKQKFIRDNTSAKKAIQKKVDDKKAVKKEKL